MRSISCSVSGCAGKHKARGFCSPHYTAWFRATDPQERVQPSRTERFWAKVDKSAGPDSCWHWSATLSENGYGQFYAGDRGVKSHRFAYELEFGPIETGLVVDHVCHNNSDCTDVPCAHRACCNPSHLEAVTQRINSIRGRSGNHQSAKTHCKLGHEYTHENTILRDNGKHRVCRTCNNISHARYNSHRKAA